MTDKPIELGPILEIWTDEDEGGDVTPWKRVVHAAECDECDMCGEPICWICEEHYADCDCPGPMQEDEYRYEEFSTPDGNLLFAQRRRIH